MCGYIISQYIFTRSWWNQHFCCLNPIWFLPRSSLWMLTRIGTWRFGRAAKVFSARARFSTDKASWDQQPSSQPTHESTKFMGNSLGTIGTIWVVHTHFIFIYICMHVCMYVGKYIYPTYMYNVINIVMMTIIIVSIIKHWVLLLLWCFFM